MDGWVDEHLRCWMDPEGNAEPLVTVDFDRLACPECLGFGRKEILMWHDRQQFWHCGRGHTFDRAAAPVGFSGAMAVTGGRNALTF